MNAASVTIRPAVVDDLPTVAEVHIEARNAYWRGIVPDADLDARAALLRRDGYTPEKLNRPGHILLIAQGTRSLLGFALLGPPHDADADPAEVGELWQIHVKPAYWRQGVGSRLHDACVAAWRAASIVEGQVEVWEHNSRACAFYSHHGWDLDGPTRPAVNGSRFLRLRLHLGSRRWPGFAGTPARTGEQPGGQSATRTGKQIGGQPGTRIGEHTAMRMAAQPGARAATGTGEWTFRRQPC